MKDLKYAEILAASRDLGVALQDQKKYKISVLSNIIVNQLNSILEYVLRAEKINAELSSGDYDNIVQDSSRYAESDAVMIFWEVANLTDGLHYKANTLNNDLLEQLVQKTIDEIKFLFTNLSATPLVLINKFSTLCFNYSNIRKDKLDAICEQLNNFLTTNLPANFVLIDLDKVISVVSVEDSIDLRYYYSSKALYTVNFFKAYSKYVAPVFLSVNGKAKKALIFDCDNTLWKGIVGEDGVAGVELSSHSKDGGIFEEIHHLAISLADNGVIIGLCSKNNPDDVTEIFAERADFSLKESHIVIKKVNWEDKASNLRNIAAELNIGIESLVFVDDSHFEINFIKDTLPAVTTIQVPEKLYSYPKVLRENLPLFYNRNTTSEDKARTTMYQAEATRKAEQSSFESLDEYLASLKLELDIQVNDENLIPRLAQLTQKTNQFNLTTRRYTETDLLTMVKSGSALLFSFGLRDRYGDYGITGGAIIHFQNTTAVLDSFLMSCRVIGRNIEIAFLNTILGYLQKNNIQLVKSIYIKTPKNSQVSNFYDSAGFDLVDSDDSRKEYNLNLKNFLPRATDSIQINLK